MGNGMKARNKVRPVRRNSPSLTVLREGCDGLGVTWTLTGTTKEDVRRGGRIHKRIDLAMKMVGATSTCKEHSAGITEGSWSRGDGLISVRLYRVRGKTYLQLDSVGMLSCDLEEMVPYIAVVEELERQGIELLNEAVRFLHIALDIDGVEFRELVEAVDALKFRGWLRPDKIMRDVGGKDGSIAGGKKHGLKLRMYDQRPKVKKRGKNTPDFDGKPAIRIEYAFTRDNLRKYGLNTVSSLFAEGALRSLMKYATTEVFRLVEKPKDQRRSGSENSKIWDLVSEKLQGLELSTPEDCELPELAIQHDHVEEGRKLARAAGGMSLKAMTKLSHSRSGQVDENAVHEVLALFFEKLRNDTSVECTPEARKALSGYHMPAGNSRLRSRGVNRTKRQARRASKGSHSDSQRKGKA